MADFGVCESCGAVIGRAKAASPALVGAAEAAAILGVSKQRLVQLAMKPDFPAPVVRLRATPVWNEGDIRLFADRRARGACSVSVGSSEEREDGQGA